MLRKLPITLIIAYPLAAYIALWLQQPLIIIGYLISIFFLLTVEKFKNKHWIAGIMLLLVIGVISYLMQPAYRNYLLFLPPILMLLSLFILFAQSLLADQTPLITRYASILGDNLDERHLRYNKNLTRLWSVFFLLMTTTSILLAIFTSLEVWSFFTYVLSYLLLGSFFIIEFMFRKHYFAGEIEGGFFQFIRKIIKIRPHNLTK
ncbi:MAG: hypothetical protein KAT06_04265 [Gammaproteobacteria bacterium]|nr:hypothetical protein [Gammaproteobacteria bacterium]